MKNESDNRNWSAILVELAKWILVLWLLLPLQRPLYSVVDFIRILLGVLLFIIFAGKLLYDTLIDAFWRKSRHHPIKDLFIMIAIISAIAFIVGSFVVFVGYFLISSWNNLQPAQ